MNVVFNLRVPGLLLPFVGPRAETQMEASFFYVLIFRSSKSIHATRLTCFSTRGWAALKEAEGRVQVSGSRRGTSVVKHPTQPGQIASRSPRFSDSGFSGSSKCLLTLSHSVKGKGRNGAYRGALAAYTPPVGDLEWPFLDKIRCFYSQHSGCDLSPSLFFPHCVDWGSPSSVCESLFIPVHSVTD